MKCIEENALVAVLDDEEADSEKPIAQILPGERARLAKAARRLAELCETEPDQRKSVPRHAKHSSTFAPFDAAEALIGPARCLVK